jgi:hypothetical protein
MGRALQRRVRAIKKKRNKAPRRDRRKSMAGSARKDKRGAVRRRQTRSNDGGRQVLGGSDFIWLTSSDRGRYISPALYPPCRQIRSSGNAATSRLSAAFSNGVKPISRPATSNLRPGSGHNLLIRICVGPRPQPPSMASVRRTQVLSDNDGSPRPSPRGR